MKFPLPKNIFPPLELSDNDEQDYEQLANTLIKATLGEYDEFVMQDRKSVDARRWKTIRTRDNVSIYRERNIDTKTPVNLALYQSAISTASSRPSQSVRPSSHAVNGHTRSFGPTSPCKKNMSSWGDPTDDNRDTFRNDSYSSGGLLSEPRITTGAFSSTDDDKNSGLPRLLAVGCLRGTLDDVMYGVVSPCASSVRLRSSYLGEHIADCSVLHEIKSPSHADPFRFLGIKWFVRAKHRGASRIVLPRDFVVLEFSGVMMRPDNSRVGFHLMHSIEIPSCRELSELHILRAKLSTCYIFEEIHHNCVQLFMTASVDPNGHVLSRMAVRSAAAALSSCWKSINCAQNKKLAFCLQNERPSTVASSRGLNGAVTRSSRGGLSVLTPVDESSVRESMGPISQRSNYSSTPKNRRQCLVCRSKLAVLSKTITCQMCGEQICSRCRIVRKLSCNTLNAQVTQSSINFCKKCVTSVSHESALDIAREELWVRARGRSRTSSAVSVPCLKKSFSSERNTYATVVLGRTSEISSRNSGTNNNSGGSPQVSSTPSQSRGPQHDESVFGYSVGPPSSASTQSSTLLLHPSLGSRSSKNHSISTSSMSFGALSSTTLTNEALLLDDLAMDRNSKVTEAADKNNAQAEEPVVLDHRMTMRSLRHLDYVLSVGEQEIVDELESEDAEDYGEFESEDEGRSSFASSVAVMDDNYEMCETPTSDAVQSRRKSLIVEGTEENDRSSEKLEQPSDQLEDKRGLGIKPKEGHLTQPLELPEEFDEPVPMAKSVYNSDGHQDVAIAEEVEVVEAAPIVEMMEEEVKKAKAASDGELTPNESQTRLNRAHTSVPFSDKTSAAYQHQLLQQMQDLHNVVESTYQVARANTEAVFKERDCDRLTQTSSSPSNAPGNLRGVRTFSQPFAFNVVGLRSMRAMTVGISK